MRDTKHEFMIRTIGVEVGVDSMTTAILALHRKVAGFGTSISALIQAQTLPTLGAPIPGAPNNIPDE